MTLDIWHYELELRANEITSQFKKRFNPAEKDAVFNDVILMWVEQQYSGNNHKKTSAETTQQRWDNLSSLLVKAPDQPPLTPVNINDGVYEFSLSSLKYPYLHMARARGVITGCTDKIKVKTVQHDDIDTYLLDPDRKPSRGPFPRLIGNLGKSSTNPTGAANPNPGESAFYVYTDGSFAISQLYIEYFKRPAVVSLGGYNDINGQPTVRVESDIPENFHSQIIDMAVDELERILRNSGEFQLSSQKQVINE